jgi:hypothetical protein
MSIIEINERSSEKPLEEEQNTDTPQYRIRFGTFTILVPDSNPGE